MRQTFQWFRDHDVELPANPIQGTQLVWKIPTQSLVRDLLCNPFYAGAYVWGRRPVATVLAEGRLEKRQGATRRAEDCRVFIPDHHVGYIDWATYEENQKMIRRNSVNWQGDESMAAIRAGQGLLAGLLRCGHDEETKQRERFLIAAPPDLGESVLYAKERRLVEMVQSEAKNRRAVQIYATYTQNVTRRLESMLNAAGIKAAVLTTQTPPEDREAWYERQLKAGVQAFIGHPRLVQTGLDLIFCPAIIWYQTGYSTFTLRQASRRSWRIGQTRPVTVRFLCYENTAQVVKISDSLM